jgi:hypothetical protein
LSGEVLPFQAIYAGKTSGSLPSPKTPSHSKATEELKFHFEFSKGDNYWSTIETMKSYVIKILASYFQSHRQQMNLPNQICIWQIDCWSVHRSLEFRSWMSAAYPWIRIHFVPANCTGIFQPCDVGIQRILKLAIRRSALKDIVDHTMEQLKSGVGPNQITFEKRLPVIRNRSVQWLINGYEAINHPEIVQKVILSIEYIVTVFTNCILQAFKLCSTGEDEFKLSYHSLRSESAQKALAERIKNSKEFSNTIYRVEPMGVEGDEVIADEDQEGSTIGYDEIDSSKTLDEEIADLMTVPGKDDEPEEVCVGTDLEQFVGHQFSAQTATAAWMKWDAKRVH